MKTTSADWEKLSHFFDQTFIRCFFHPDRHEACGSCRKPPTPLTWRAGQRHPYKSVADKTRADAKDYAILSRMRCENFELPVKEGYMYDYFISGIRGLGTCGATYFIDRNYNVLNRYTPEQDIQLLLEVHIRIKDIQHKDRINRNRRLF